MNKDDGQATKEGTAEGPPQGKGIRIGGLSLRLRWVVSGGIVFVLAWLFMGFINDVSSVDSTKGGYDPPYANWTGQPIDWGSWGKTGEGFVKRGAVMDYYVDCTTGGVSFAIFGVGIKVGLANLSERTLIIHEPREACIQRGFAPEF